MPATSTLGLAEVGGMNEKIIRDEMRYQISLSLAKSLLSQKLITTAEFNKIDALLLQKYQPYIGGLTSQNA